VIIVELCVLKLYGMLEGLLRDQCQVKHKNTHYLMYSYLEVELYNCNVNTDGSDLIHRDAKELDS